MLSIVGTNKKSGVALRDLREGQCFTIDDRHYRKTGESSCEAKIKCYSFEDNRMKFHSQATRVDICKLKLTHDEDESHMARPEPRTIAAQCLQPGDHFKTPHGANVYVRVSEYTVTVLGGSNSRNVYGICNHNGNIKDFTLEQQIVPVAHGETK